MALLARLGCFASGTRERRRVHGFFAASLPSVLAVLQAMQNLNAGASAHRCSCRDRGDRCLALGRTNRLDVVGSWRLCLACAECGSRLVSIISGRRWQAQSYPRDVDSSTVCAGSRGCWTLSLLQASCRLSLKWVRVVVTFLSAMMLLSSVSIKVVDAVSGRKKETELEQS